MSALRLSSDHPLAARGAFETAGVRLRALPMASCLRLQLAKQVARGEHLAATGPVELPFEPNTTAGVDPVTLWLSPDAWLLVSEHFAPDVLRDALGPLLRSRRCALTDASSAYERLELSGAGARSLLATGCGLDLRADRFGSGQCARTRFAQIGLLVRPNGADSFELFVDRSLGDWLWDWVAEGAALRASPPDRET